MADSLYDRLGGAFAIAAVIDRFSDAVLLDPIAGQLSANPYLREWSTDEDASRMPGLKFLRTLWVCDISGGPQKYAGTDPGATPLGLEEAHREYKISPAIFDHVATVLAESLDVAGVQPAEKAEVLAAFAAHKTEINEGYSQ